MDWSHFTQSSSVSGPQNYIFLKVRIHTSFPPNPCVSHTSLTTFLPSGFNHSLLADDFSRQAWSRLSVPHPYIPRNLDTFAACPTDMPKPESPPCPFLYASYQGRASYPHESRSQTCWESLCLITRAQVLSLIMFTTGPSLGHSCPTSTYSPWLLLCLVLACSEALLCVSLIPRITCRVITWLQAAGTVIINEPNQGPNTKTSLGAGLKRLRQTC